MKIKKKNIIILSIFLIVIISIFVLIGFFISKTNQNPYGSRCDDALEHKISSKTIKSIKSKFKEIDKVDSVDVYTKLCTVKIIINFDANPLHILDIISLVAMEAKNAIIDILCLIANQIPKMLRTSPNHSGKDIFRSEILLKRLSIPLDKDRQ